jgi:hypothetical protein
VLEVCTKYAQALIGKPHRNRCRLRLGNGDRGVMTRRLRMNARAPTSTRRFPRRFEYPRDRARLVRRRVVTWAGAANAWAYPLKRCDRGPRQYAPRCRRMSTDVSAATRGAEGFGRGGCAVNKSTHSLLPEPEKFAGSGRRYGDVSM